METQTASDVAVGSLVAGDHVLRDALQTDDCVGSQRNTPPLAVTLAKIIRRSDGGEAFHRSDGVSTRDRGVRSIEIGRLDFDIADALFSSEPIFAREECGVRIRKCAAGRDYGEADELYVDRSGLGRSRGDRQRWGRGG